MKIKNIFRTARCLTIEIEDGSIFETEQKYDIYINDVFYGTTTKVITSIYNLKPDTDYVISVVCGEEKAYLPVRTDYEFVTLNVRDFGAKGDGEQDDTLFIQAAVMACPKESRVLVPEGVYRITSLFLKDDIRIELALGAVLSAETDRTRFPVFPGMIQSYDEEQEYNLGTWEGNPLPMFAGIITGVNVKNVLIYGEGEINGNASDKPDNWWYNPKQMRIAFRPRMIFLNHCENVVVEGITVRNSPSWNIHPYFSRHLRFLNLSVLNPKDSPNTDGLDPESCQDVEVAGVYFSLGDDCIAVKSGKIYMGSKYKVPSEDIMIRQCCMRDGHGSITIGSEMAGGVRNLIVRDCLFLNTDRGLRIKTRRGRGKDAIIDGILFENIRMDHVMTPFVINSFYFCDPDGYSEYVRTKEMLPVDGRTPDIRTLVFHNIEATNCHVAAAFFYGLPEKKIRKILMEHIRISFAAEPKCAAPAMMEEVKPCTGMGIFAQNIETLLLRDVQIEGQEGEAEILGGINQLQR
ncbi:MAG: glycoside hydrolase family 28 protein [Lachnospiraceae bacterium]